MWIFNPSNCVPESECSEKVSGPHSSTLAADIEPFVTWSGKPVPPANLPRLWKRERSMKRLSGLTLSRSTAQRGADAWIASLPASRARTFLLPASGLGSTESAPASSSTLPTSPMLAVRDSSFWRTSQASLLPPPPLWTKPKASSKNERPPESWENWPTAGGLRNGCIYARPTSAPIISANVGSASLGGTWLTPFGMSGIEAETGKVGAGGEFAKQVHQWQTPTTMAAKGVEYQRQADGTNLAILSGQAQQWATPTSSENSNRTTKMAPTHGNGHGIVLAGQACQWATPKASETDRGVCPSEIARRSPGLLTQTATWATPTARDHKDGATTLENVEVNGLLGRQVLTTSLRPVHSMIDGRELSPTARTLRRRLNPAFTCWLMGWPIWWTNPAITNSVKLETELWRCKLRLQLSRLLDEPTSFEEAA
jgi:hypothetical protein